MLLLVPLKFLPLDNNITSNIWKKLKQRSIMTGFVKDQPPCRSSDGSSTSRQSEYDQEIGSDTTQKDNEDVIVKYRSFLCFPLQIDLTLIRMVVAEALGTFILMFSIGGIIASTQLTKGQVGLLEYAVTAALAVIVVVFSIGHISGAHVNPAVTIAFAIFGPFPWKKVPFYIFAQVAGASLATYVATLVYGMKPQLMTTIPLGGWAAAFWAEFVASFTVLFLTASLVHAPQSVIQFAGFIIAVAIGLGVLITGPISGGSMNPARSLGPAIVARKFEGLWVYLIAPTVGAISGAFTLKLLKPCTSSSSTSSTNPDLHSTFIQLD